MAFLCKKVRSHSKLMHELTPPQCKKAFRKDMAHYEEADEYCPHCDNHYVSTVGGEMTLPVPTVYRLESTCDAATSPTFRAGVPRWPRWSPRSAETQLCPGHALRSTTRRVSDLQPFHP